MEKTATNNIIHYSLTRKSDLFPRYIEYAFESSLNYNFKNIRSAPDFKKYVGEKVADWKLKLKARKNTQTNSCLQGLRYVPFRAMADPA